MRPHPPHPPGSATVQYVRICYQSINQSIITWPDTKHKTDKTVLVSGAVTECVQKKAAALITVQIHYTYTPMDIGIQCLLNIMKTAAVKLKEKK